MKGVILAGGSGTRLRPLTKVTNKHLLPVYSKPMIYYPIQTLLNAGVKKILIVTGNESAGDFMKLLGSGKELGAEFTYKLQDGSFGIAHALSLAEDFVGKEKFIVVLGDNVIEDNISEAAKDFESNNYDGLIFLKSVHDPERFGVVELSSDKITGIEEKPKQPKTNFAVTGVYMYSPSIFDIIRKLKPSARGELEITDVNNALIERNKLTHKMLSGFWSDAGTFPSLFRASEFAKENEEPSSNSKEH
ncbi:MAG: NTP transferase domain-containing protein [Candidatus Aenigmarchaeota archaeon]|nr:NTP transferase domain-containing protein [Candidatus Aenigmarchaeota archaeon]